MRVDEVFSPAQRYCFLAGAGISVDSPSNLPLAADIVHQVIASLQLETGIEQKMRDDFARRALRFEQFLELIWRFYDPHLHVLDHLAACSSPNMSHHFLARALERGHAVFTTNFDRLIELACAQRGLSVRSVCDSMQRRTQKNETELKVWKLHGSLLNEQGKDTRETVAAMLSRVGQKGEAFGADPHFRTAFQQDVAQRDLVVLGYSGRDDYDVVPMISEARSDRRIIWVWHHPDVFPSTAFPYAQCPPRLKDALGPCDRILTLGNWRPEQLVVIVGRTPWIVRELGHTLLGSQDSETPADEYRVPDRYYTQWRIKHALEDWKHAGFVGLYHLSRGDYEVAYRAFSLALADAEKGGAFLPILNVTLWLSETSLRRGDTERAWKHLEEYYGLLHEPRDKAWLAEFDRMLPADKQKYLVDYYQHLAMCCTAMGRYEEAQAALENSPTQEDTAPHARQLYEMARLLRRKGDNLAAVEKARQAIGIHRKYGNLNSLSMCLLLVGEALVDMNDLAEAGKCFDEAVRICGLTGNRDVLAHCEAAQRQLQKRGVQESGR